MDLILAFKSQEAIAPLDLPFSNRETVFSMLNPALMPSQAIGDTNI